MIGFTLGFNVNSWIVDSWIVGGVGMSTTMTELDWQAAVAVFRVLPRRGTKGRKLSATIAARSAASFSAFM